MPSKFTLNRGQCSHCPRQKKRCLGWYLCTIENTSKISLYDCCLSTHMKMKASYAIFWLSVFVYISEFVSTPTSINATLGSTATFSCSVTTGAIVWVFNESQLSELLVSDIKASQVGDTFFLHVPAKVEYNNSVVTCILVILGGDDLYCDEVLLMVQGTYVKEWSLYQWSLFSLTCYNLHWNVKFQIIWHYYTKE